MKVKSIYSQNSVRHGLLWNFFESLIHPQRFFVEGSGLGLGRQEDKAKAKKDDLFFGSANELDEYMKALEEDHC